MNFLNLTSFLKIRPSKFPKEREDSVVVAPKVQYAAELDFWKQELSGELPVMEWPSKRIHSVSPHTSRQQYTFTIHSKLKEKINIYTSNKNIDIYIFLIAALRILLYRYFRQEDLVIGNVITLNKHSGDQFPEKAAVNALPLRIQMNGNQSFQNVLRYTQQIAAKADRNRNIPYQALAEGINPLVDKSHPSIFQILFHWQNISSKISSPKNSILNELESNNIAVPDLILEILEQPGTLVCSINYNTQLLHSDIIERMAAHLECLLERILENDELPVGLLPMLTIAELNQQLIEFNQPALQYTPACAHHIFEQQVSRTPDAVALVFGQQQLSYHELNSKANQLAHRLQRFGVGPEVIVGLCMHRSPQLLIGLLGILKAGGAFMPLDPTLPSDRLTFMLQDAAPALIVTQEGLADLAVIAAAHIPLIYLDRDWPWISQESAANVMSTVDPSNLMYVIYTSGSSGKPKGVLIAHHSLASFLKAYERVIDLDEHDRVLQFVPVVFDPMVEDIFCAFQKGSCLVLRTEEMAESAEIFFEKCKEWGVTLLNLPAAFWHFLVGELTHSNGLQLPECIRIVKVGGERLLPDKVAVWKNRFGGYPRLLNAYGPTETTIAATMYDCFDFKFERGEVPIGLRLANLKIYVVDAFLQPVPVGLPGELCIGGEALARGYLNRSELTIQKFIADPFSDKPDARLYRTGDRVRYLPDGKLEYQARLDDQVKIRGFRIELGEIESVLGQHPQIKQVAVVVREDVPGDKRIIAYIVMKTVEVDLHKLREYLLESLPNYMIPAVFVPLEKLPLTFNGKVDRNALPMPNWSDQLARSNYKAPQTQEERIIVSIWEQLLNTKGVGVEDHFFEIGGHSLLAAKLITEIKHTFNLKLPLAWIFAHPTISEQASYMASAPSTSLWDTLINIRIGGSKSPFYIIHDGYGGVEYGFQLSQFMDKDRPVFGFQAVGLNGIDEPLQSVEAIADYYIERLLTYQPDGTYHLGAYSGGATIAFEMACKLKAKGKQVGIVAIFDSYPINLNRFTYQRVGLSYIIHSIGNLIFSPNIPLVEKIKVISSEIPEIVQKNWMRIKLRSQEKKADPLISPSEKVFRAMRSSIDRYRFKCYSGPLLFMRSIENPARYLRKSDFGWGRYAAHVSIYDFPGDHKALFKNKENVKTVADIIKMHLAEFENTNNCNQ